MQVCKEHHEEICYNSASCPLCSALEDIQTLTCENALLESTLEDVEDNYNKLTKSVAEHMPELLI